MNYIRCREMICKISMSCPLAIFILFGAMVSITQARTLVLGANYWEPFTGQGLEGNGIASRFVEKLLTRAGYNVEVIILPWTRVYSQAAAGRLDGIVSIWNTQKRREKILFSDVYYSNKIVLLKRRATDFTYEGIESLDGYTVGIGRGYDYSDFFQSRHKIIQAPTVTLGQNLKKLVGDRIDFVLTDEVIARFTVSNHELRTEFCRELEVVGRPVLLLPLSFGVSKHVGDAEEILTNFNHQLAMSMEDGTYARQFKEVISTHYHDTVCID